MLFVWLGLSNSALKDGLYDTSVLRARVLRRDLELEKELSPIWEYSLKVTEEEHFTSPGEGLL